MKDVTVISKTIPANPRSGNYPQGASVAKTGGGTTIVNAGSESSTDILKENDSRSLSDANVMSSLRAVSEFISRKNDSSIKAIVDYLNGIKINGTPVTRIIQDATTVEAYSDTEVMSALRIAKEIISNNEKLKDEFLSKTKSDRTPHSLEIGEDLTVEGITKLLRGLISQGESTLYEGSRFGPEYIPGLLGKGGMIDGSGRGELRSLRLWESLEVPEIRYNRALVYTGIYWQTFGGGIIESVEIDTDQDGNELQTGTITLKLEDGEYGAVDTDDLCMGIFHDYGGINDTETSDSHTGNFRFQGFNTSYFRITEIQGGNNKVLRYALRGISGSWTQLNHPRPQMHFACYSNPVNVSRQSCKYSTTEYSIRVENMTTWEFGEDNIYYIEGKLDGFSMHGKSFKGNGIVFGNAYMYGKIDQFERIPRTMSFDTGGDNMISEGEVKRIQSVIKDGYLRDVTSEYSVWSVTRETGDAAADNVWNSRAVITNGAWSVTWADIGAGNKALFLVTATGDGYSVSAFAEL